MGCGAPQQHCTSRRRRRCLTQAATISCCYPRPNQLTPDSSSSPYAGCVTRCGAQPQHRTARRRQPVLARAATIRCCYPRPNQLTPDSSSLPYAGCVTRCGALQQHHTARRRQRRPTAAAMTRCCYPRPNQLTPDSSSSRYTGCVTRCGAPQQHRTARHRQRRPTPAATTHCCPQAGRLAGTRASKRPSTLTTTPRHAPLAGAVLLDGKFAVCQHVSHTAPQGVHVSRKMLLDPCLGCCWQSLGCGHGQSFRLTVDLGIRPSRYCAQRQPQGQMQSLTRG